MTEPQRCGTCVHFELREPDTGIGWCHAPIPDCVDAESAVCVYRMGGVRCPSYEMKESDDAE